MSQWREKTRIDRGDDQLLAIFGFGRYRNMPTKAFLARINGKLLRASHYLGNHLVCIGKFFVEGPSALNGRFECVDTKVLAVFPTNGGVLRLSTEPERLKVRNFH